MSLLYELIFCDSLLNEVGRRAKANEKYAIMTPFNIINKMLGPYLFSPNARESLGDKMELYFHDHAFVPLFIQVRVFSFLYW